MNERDQGLFDILLLYNCAIFRLLAELPPFKCLNIFTFFHFIKPAQNSPISHSDCELFFPGLSETFFSPLSRLASNRPAKSSSTSQPLTPPPRIDKLCTMATFLSTSFFSESTLRSTFCLAFSGRTMFAGEKKLFSFAWRRFSLNFANETKTKR